MSLRIVSDARNAVQGLEKTSSAVGKFLKVAGAAAVAAAGAALVKYGVDAVGMAGDLEQSVGAIDTVFKGSAGQMHAWAKSAANDVGLTANEYNELGTLIGTQLKNGGTAMDQLAPKTNQLIGLGADLSSMFGGTSKEAIEALSSALKGERDPIEKYGVSLNQAKIDAEAAALGFEKVGGSLSTEASQAATLSLIMKQTADAHGNFAKEASTLQGQQQRMTAGWKNIQTTLGGLLLPALTALYSFINTNILPVFASWADSMANGGLQAGFDGLIAKAEPFIGFAKSLWTVISPLIPQIMELATSFSPLSIVMQAITPLLPQISAALGTVANMLGNVLAAVVPLASALLAQIVPVFSQLVSSVFPMVIGVITQLVTAVAPLVTQLVGALAPILTNLASTLFPLVSSAITAVVGAIMPLVNILLATLIPVIQSLLPVVTQIFGAIATVIQGVMQVIAGVIQVVTGVISGNWSQVWEGIKNIFQGIWNTISGIVSTVIEVIKGVIQVGLGIIQGIISGILTGISNLFSSIWNGIVSIVSGVLNTIVSAARSGFDKFSSAVSNGISNAVSFIAGLPGKITGALGDMGSLLIGAGRAVLDGFLSGLKNAWEGVKNFVGGIGDWIVNNKGPISYDKRMLKPAGAAIMDGLVSSMRAAMPDLEKVVGKATDTILGIDAKPSVDLRARGNQTTSAASAGRTVKVEINFNGVVTDKVGTVREIRRLFKEVDLLEGKAV